VRMRMSLGEICLGSDNWLDPTTETETAMYVCERKQQQDLGGGRRSVGLEMRSE